MACTTNWHQHNGICHQLGGGDRKQKYLAHRSRPLEPPRPCPLPSMGTNTNGIYYQGASIPTIFTITGHQYQWYLASMGINTNGIHTNGHPYQWYPYQSALSTALSAALAMTNVSPLEWGGSLPPPRQGWGLIISKSLTN